MRRREFIGLVQLRDGRVAAGGPGTEGTIRIGLMAGGAAASVNSAAQIDAISEGLREMAHELAQAGVRPCRHHRMHPRSAESQATGTCCHACDQRSGRNRSGRKSPRPGGVTTGMATS